MSHLSLKTWLRNRWICTPLWNPDGPELPENAFSFDKPSFSHSYFFNFTYFIFSIKVPISIVLYFYTWSALFVTKYRKIWSVHRNWNPDTPKVAKVLVFQTYLEIPTSPFRQLHLWIFVSGSELTISYCNKTLALNNLWSYSLHWLEFFHQNLHRQLFSIKNAFIF